MSGSIHSLSFLPSLSGCLALRLGRGSFLCSSTPGRKKERRKEGDSPSSGGERRKESHLGQHTLLLFPFPQGQCSIVKEVEVELGALPYCCCCSGIHALLCRGGGIFRTFLSLFSVLFYSPIRLCRTCWCQCSFVRCES